MIAADRKVKVANIPFKTYTIATVARNLDGIYPDLVDYLVRRKTLPKL